LDTENVVAATLTGAAFGAGGAALGTASRAAISNARLRIVSAQAAHEPVPTIKPTVSETGFGGYRATWGSDPKAFAMFEPQGSGVQVTDLFRGAQPKGSGGEMLADALRGAGITRPEIIRFAQIINEPTLEQMAKGVSLSKTTLGRTLVNTVRKLGGEIANWKSGIYRDKPWIEVSIKYPGAR
jgi:hypothetical protein